MPPRRRLEGGAPSGPRGLRDVTLREPSRPEMQSGIAVGPPSRPSPAPPDLLRGHEGHLLRFVVGDADERPESQPRRQGLDRHANE
jgi:hypothetical protein